MSIRLMLADDHRMLREGLRRSMIDQGFDVVGEARDGEEAIRLAHELRPEVILMDVTMPEVDGVEATRQIRSELPEIKVVMLTMHADQEVLTSAIRAGANGYLVKDCSTEEIASAVRMAVSGETALSPQLAASMLDEVRRLDRPSSEEDRIVTRREEEVLQLIADGLLHPGGGRKAVHQPEDGQEPPGFDLPEARRPRPHPGRAPGRAHGHREPGLTPRPGGEPDRRPRRVVAGRGPRSACGPRAKGRFPSRKPRNRSYALLRFPRSGDDTGNETGNLVTTRGGHPSAPDKGDQPKCLPRMSS